MKNFSGRITFDYYATNVEDLKALDIKLNTLIDLLSRRSNDLDGVSWDNVEWTIEEEFSDAEDLEFDGEDLEVITGHFGELLDNNELDDSVRRRLEKVYKVATNKLGVS
jgi:hypothetical protein